MSGAAKVSPFAWEGYVDPESGWILVADGMGGHAAGEVASVLAVQCLRAAMADLTTEGAIRRAIDATNLALQEAVRQQPSLTGMGTTIAGLRLMGTKALCFNVGDSRVYVSDDGSLRQVSVDHVVQRHALTQCLGASGATPLDPHVRVLPVKRKTRFLLCTDGLTDIVQDDEISTRLSSAQPAASLVKAALAVGGIDNVTAAVLHSF